MEIRENGEMSEGIQASIRRFWLEECTAKMRFQKDPTFDREIERRFGPCVERALAGELDSWGGTPESALSLILVLDQFTRNIYRETPQMIAGEIQALRMTLTGVERGDLETFTELEAQFYLMPMMHAEDLEVQEASIPLFEAHCGSRVVDYAIRHRDIVQRFGRFPHRNAILGRASTSEEREFLQLPGSGF